MARRYTPFNGAGGESFTTDAERMQFADAQRQASIDALRQAQQPQQAMQPQIMGVPVAQSGTGGGDFNDWNNRLRASGEEQQRLMQAGGDQDRLTIQAGDVGKNYRADAQMKPSLMGAEDARAQYTEGKPLRDFKTQYAMEALKGLAPGDMVGGAVGGGADGRPGMNPKLQEQIVRGIFNVGPDPEDQYNLKAKQQLQEALRSKGFEMASSPDPRMRAQGAAILKSQGVQLPGGGLVGPGGDPQRTQEFLAQPQTNVKIQQLLATAQRGMGSMRPEIAAQDIQTAMQEIASLAQQYGADPEQVKAMVMQKVEQSIPETNFWNNPIRTTLGLGGALFDTSENDLRKNLGY